MKNCHAYSYVWKTYQTSTFRRSTRHKDLNAYVSNVLSFSCLFYSWMLRSSTFVYPSSICFLITVSSLQFSRCLPCFNHCFRSFWSLFESIFNRLQNTTVYWSRISLQKGSLIFLPNVMKCIGTNCRHVYWSFIFV